jgi:hypothetical protein
MISDHGLNLPGELWDSDNASTNLRQGVLSSSGQATLTLWIPRVPGFPRLTRIPFVLCLTLRTQKIKGVPVDQPPDDILPPAPQFEKASMFLRRSIRSCARGGTQTHKNMYDGAPADNMLHGITPQEGAWTMNNYEQMRYWEKGYMWRGLWTFKEAPNFENRQLSWEVWL